MRSPLILLIGDEPTILKTLRRNLHGRGYEVSIALDDEETYQMIRNTSWDLFILDLDFITINIDGLTICQELRRQSQTPIIVLSSVGSETIKVRAFDLGADDYVVMPFNVSDLLTRVRSAIRRWIEIKDGTILQTPLILTGDLLIDTETRQVTVRSEPIRLTPTEYDILFYLAGRNGRVVTHSELLRAIWGSQHTEEREYLRVYISQLRRKIEVDPLHPDYILTEPGIGYRFAVDS